MNTLQVKRETIEQDNALLAALATLDLRVQELERAKNAIKEAEQRLDIIVKESLKKKPLKWQAGELVYVEDVKRLYYYADDDFMVIPQELWSKNE
jgi:hypothetical protein